VAEQTSSAPTSNKNGTAAAHAEVHCPDETPRECFARATAIAAADLGPEKESKVFAMMFEACDRGYAEACLLFAQLRWKASPTDAFDAYLHACDLGEASGCRKAGAVLVHGAAGVDKDVKRGFQLLAKACDAGECVACLKLAEYYRKGEVVPPDPRSVEEYEKLGEPCAP
jgi:TPR repeat protein